jgi:hypothetical protein
MTKALKKILNILGKIIVSIFLAPVAIFFVCGVTLLALMMTLVSLPMCMIKGEYKDAYLGFRCMSQEICHAFSGYVNLMKKKI